MFIKIVNRYLCHNAKKVIEIKRNPYLSLTTKQLIDIINNSINNQSKRIQHLNTLILLGQASKKKHLGAQLKKLTQKCLINLNRIQLNINSYQQQELKVLQFAELLNILDSKKQVFDFNFKQLNDLTQLYVNTYSHIFSFQKQLQIYETVSKNGQLDFLKNACISKIQDHIQNCTLNLSEFVRYLRMFNSRVSPQKLQNRLIEMKKSPALCKLSQSQTLTLYFLMMNKSLDLKIIEQLGLQPSLIIKSNDNPKQTCIRLQIIKYKNLQIPNLQFLDLIQWDYIHLVWLSQFSFKSSSIFKNRLHQAIISLPLPKESLPSSIFFYATNTQIQQQKHRQINLWLCQNITQSKNEQNLCQMLKQIHQKHWQPFYKQFFRHVLKMSLGNFKWQSQNIIYYMGQVQKIQDQNMQYLRRYILNTYASLGTARKQVPTSSYFYKILQITNVQSFYKNL